MPGTKDFEERAATQAALTIQKGGQISLNQAAYAAFGRPSTVELLYDRAASVVGLRAVEPRAAHGYPVRLATRRGSGPFIISALAFTRFYDIDTSRTRRWPVTVRDGVLLADLTQVAMPVVGAQPDARLPDARLPELHR